MLKDRSQAILATCVYSEILRRWLRAYLFHSGRLWRHLPASFRLRAYGKHLHALVCACAQRSQNHSTFFLRNRAELELMRRLISQKANGSSVDISVLACSKGAEVYSILWTIRSARPDLRLRMQAVDISEEILEFAKQGVYSLRCFDPPTALDRKDVTEKEKLIWNTCRDQPDQNPSVFERMSDAEVEAMFEIEGDQVRVRSWLKEGINWLRGDAGDPGLARLVGRQDVVVANRFLCHMEPLAAEACLHNVARLVKPGGYLFVSGVDLDVRARVAREMGWQPVTDLIREIHEGDPSLRYGWPLEWWGLEPFSDDDPDWEIRYASVFQIGVGSGAAVNVRADRRAGVRGVIGRNQERQDSTRQEV